MTATNPNETGAGKTYAAKDQVDARPLADEELDELCRILIGADRVRLREAIERLQERGQFIDWQSQTLADAMRLALARDPAFKESMGSMISQGVHSTVQRDSAAFGRALAPAMGPAIRNAVWMMLQGFVQSIETVVDQQLSWRSVRWRIEAMRTGRKFAEIAFLHTLLYRVEHVFLIHKVDGVQLLHATRPGVIAREPDLIAAMLTAIQDFLRDAFEAPQEDSATSFSINELNVTVENGNHAVLAAVVRGQPRADVRLQLREALDRIETSMAAPLQEFDGETDAFEAVRPQLEACLTETPRPQAAATKKKKSPAVRWGLLTGALLLTTWWIIGMITAAHQRERFEGFVTALKAEPGYAITDSEVTDDGIVVHGMRDPLARPLAEIAGIHSVVEVTVAHLQDYHSLHPAFVAQRVRQTLQVPPGIEFELEGRALVVRGTANHAWLARTAAVAAAIDGIDSVDLSACQDSDRLAFDATTTELHELDPALQELTQEGDLRRRLALLLNQLTIDASRLDRRLSVRANLVWWAKQENRTAARTARTVVADLSRAMGVHIELGAYQRDEGVKDATLRFTARLREQ